MFCRRDRRAASLQDRVKRFEIGITFRQFAKGRIHLETDLEMHLGVFEISEKNVVAAHVVIIDRLLEQRGWSSQQQLFCLERFTQLVQAKPSVQKSSAALGRDAAKLAANGQCTRPLFFAHEMMKTQLQDFRTLLKGIIDCI